MLVTIQNNIPLAPYTTLKIGGSAKYFVKVRSQEELAEVCNWAKKEVQKIFVLGGGSNTLISDEGFNGLVILIDIKGQTHVQDNDRQEIIADIKAGEVWDDFVLESTERGLQGVECLSGIPGRVGASAVQDIGAYGQEVCEVIQKVRFYDIEKREFNEYSSKECHFELSWKYF